MQFIWEPYRAGILAAHWLRRARLVPSQTLIILANANSNQVLVAVCRPRANILGDYCTYHGNLIKNNFMLCGTSLGDISLRTAYCEACSLVAFTLGTNDRELPLINSTFVSIRLGTTQGHAQHSTSRFTAADTQAD